ncbi:ABC transporter ATP-binding protein [Natronospora cellulosivora (SeqCode)]
MILDVRGVSKIYSKGKSKVTANDNLSFSINEGEIFGFFGHNGAGKTTLVKQIIGLTKSTSGEIELLGKSVLEDPKRARSICSIQPQSQLPLGFLTPNQAVTIMGKMRGASKKDVKARMEYLFRELDIEQWANKEGNSLSGGVRRLTAFCMAVIVPGKLVILDEPTNDVDPVRRRYLWKLIRELTNQGSSVILVTHNVMEAEKAVDRMAILDMGRFLITGTPAEVKSSVSNLMRVELNLLTDDQVIEIPEWVVSSHRNGTRLYFSLKQSSALSAIEWASKEVENGNVIDYSMSPTSIEDVYVKLTSGKEMSA